jgi:hypothetical protein
MQLKCYFMQIFDSSLKGAQKIIHSASLCLCWASLSFHLSADVLIKEEMNRKKEIKSSKLSHMRNNSRDVPRRNICFLLLLFPSLRPSTFFLLLMNTFYATLIVKSLFSRLSHISLVSVCVGGMRNKETISTYFPSLVNSSFWLCDGSGAHLRTRKWN